MYVHRPQHVTGHAPGCSSSRCRGGPHHHVGRQAAKMQRKSQPKPRRMPNRRRYSLRDLVGQAGHRLRIAAEPAAEMELRGGAVQDSGEWDCCDLWNGRRCRQKGTRARLRARLVQRSCNELEIALKRKHGKGWPEHVLQGGFPVHEAMHRICEAFSLRPELEQLIVHSTINHARALISGASSPERSHHASEMMRAGTFPEISEQPPNEHVALSNDASATRTTIDFKALPRNTFLRDEAVSTSDGDSVAGTLDGASSDTAASLEQEEETEADDFITLAPLEESGTKFICGPASVPTAKAQHMEEAPRQTLPRGVPWRIRALRTLGLDDLWASVPSSSSPSSSPQTATPMTLSDGNDGNCNGNDGNGNNDRCVVRTAGLLVEDAEKEEPELEEETEDSEELALSSKLMAAVRNAELHAAAGSAGKGARQLPAASCSSVNLKSMPASLAVRFAETSEVSFYSGPAGPEQPWTYQRELDTKVFDGPSGHKAKRIPAMISKTSFLESDGASGGTSSAGNGRDQMPEIVSPPLMCAAPPTAQDEEEDFNFDEEEEWEDHCDDIADLMCQQRSCLLWSPSW